MAPGLIKIMNQITFQATSQTSTSAAFQVGQQGQTPNGNIYVYVQAAGAITKNLAAIPNTVTTVSNASSSTNNLGQIVYVTKASAGWTNGQFAGDYVFINAGTGSGQLSRIMDNTTDTLYLFAPGLGTALDVASSGFAIYKPWKAIVAAVTSKLQNCMGIAAATFASGEYGWLLQKGIGSVVAGEVLVIGSNFTTGDDTAGEVIKGITGNGQFDAQSLGRCLVANSGADLAAAVYVDVL